MGLMEIWENFKLDQTFYIGFKFRVCIQNPDMGDIKDYFKSLFNSLISVYQSPNVNRNILQWMLI